MKQFFSVLKFEYFNYTKTKPFIILTTAMILLIGAVLFYPRVFKQSDDGNPVGEGEKSVIALMDLSAKDPTKTAAYFNAAGTSFEFSSVEKSIDELKEDIKNGVYLSGVVIDSDLKYRYFVNDVAMNDQASYVIDQLMINKYRQQKLEEIGASSSDIQQILYDMPQKEVIQTGKNQMVSFLYTYVLIFALYMAILLYGQFVATGVAAEKSSRAMELLITSAKPTNLMFGKVIGSGLAGLTQMGLILGSGFVFYSLNKPLWGGNMFIESIFGMPFEILLYALLFFILGFFVYAFMYGALGSLANRTEDVNGLVMPVTFLFIIAFMFTMFSMGSGDVDSIGMKILSYVPFTSPMAMFARISMSHVSPFEIMLSVGILLASTIGIGYIAAGIYKVGVLIYGKAPKLKEIIKVIKTANK